MPFGNGTDLYIRGSNTILAAAGSNYTNFTFSTNSPVYCYGNVMHLYDYTQDLTDFPSNSDARGLKYLFANCTALVRPPSLTAKAPQVWCYYYMFYNCTSLSYIPKIWLTGALTGYGEHMFDRCSLIKMSTTSDSEYNTLYEIPNPMVGSLATDMFINTGGTFQGTPEGATNTLYTANEVID